MLEHRAHLVDLLLPRLRLCRVPRLPRPSWPRALPIRAALEPRIPCSARFRAGLSSANRFESSSRSRISFPSFRSSLGARRAPPVPPTPPSHPVIRRANPPIAACAAFPRSATSSAVAGRPPPPPPSWRRRRRAGRRRRPLVGARARASSAAAAAAAPSSAAFSPRSPPATAPGSFRAACSARSSFFSARALAAARRCVACAAPPAPSAARRFDPNRSAHDRRRAAACSVVAAPYRAMKRRAPAGRAARPPLPRVAHCCRAPPCRRLEGDGGGARLGERVALGGAAVGGLQLDGGALHRRKRWRCAPRRGVGSGRRDGQRGAAPLLDFSSMNARKKTFDLPSW